MTLGSLKTVEVPPGRGTILDARELRMYFPLARSFTETIARKNRRVVKAVDGVDLRIEEGKVVGLVGESGCGKTTLGKVIGGLYRPTSGAIYYKPTKDLEEELARSGLKGVEASGGLLYNIAHMDHRTLRLLRRESQIVLQDPYGALNPRMTVREIIEEPLIIQGGMSDEERTQRVLRTLEEVRLSPPEDFVARYPHHLSGGQRQRVNLARAIILGPRLVIADEPVSMLDASIRAEILRLMIALKRDLNLTYLFITHDLAVASIICDYINVMYLGKVVESGPADKVLTDPQHPYTKALIAAVPSPDPAGRWVVKEVPISGEVPAATTIPSGCRFHTRCPYAWDLCNQKEPGEFTIAPGHWASCWLYEKGPRSGLAE